MAALPWWQVYSLLTLLGGAIGPYGTLIGAGGGAFHVPLLVYLLHFPLHVATATSHFTLVIMSLIGSVTHVLTGDFAQGIRRTLALAVGVLLGAQLGRCCRSDSGGLLSSASWPWGLCSSAFGWSCRPCSVERSAIPGQHDGRSSESGQQATAGHSKIALVLSTNPSTSSTAAGLVCA